MSVIVRLRKLSCAPWSRRYSSPVLKGDKLKKTDKFLTPFIDLRKRMEDLSKLQENIELRKLSIDPVKLKSLWDFFKYLQSTRSQLENRKMQILNHIQDLKKIGEDAEALEEMTKLKIEWKVVREDLKTLMTAFWEVEEKVTINGLMLPNELHEDTPSKEDRIVHEFGSFPQVTNPASHLDIGVNLDLIDYRDPSCFFLKNEAALFEISCAYYFADELKKNDFLSFCNPDCVRSGLVDICGYNSANPNAVFTVKENIDRPENSKNYNLHLVGGASIYPFCAFHTKQVVSVSCLPLKYFTIGRQYSPCSLDSKRGLYDTWQRTTNEIFILTANDYDEMMLAFQRTLELCISLYEKFNCHFRVVYVKASDLESWESLRASFQMYSCHERKYIEIGKLSISDSFICRKLMMTYQMSEADNAKRFMKMVSGTVVDITKLLACILEQRNNMNEKFSMPDFLKSHWFL